jgi:hypothetical protein
MTAVRTGRRIKVSDDIHLIIEALESYTGLPWDYLKIAHPSIEKLFKSCAGTISRDDLIEISKTICDRCTMGDKLCDAIMNLLSAQPETHEKRTETHACDCISRRTAIDALYTEIIKRRLMDDVNDGMLDEFDTESILRKLPPAQPE